jgi:hypothetical protein
VAANLLVRRMAFEEIGGFYEGLRAAEDTDFTWRLQQAGWRLDARPEARVEHRYRVTLGELRRQWRGYAAGRAWLARRYDGFEPQPAVTRALRRARGSAPPRDVASPGRIERGRFLALDALLAAEELAGLALSNRPVSEQGDGGPIQVVLVADRFPAPGDPLVDLARTLESARVEASARPDIMAPGQLTINYREDDGAALRTWALIALVVRHPLRCALDAIRRRPGDPALSALAPAVRRLEQDPQARVHALGRNQARAVARRLARLAGRALQD